VRAAESVRRLDSDSPPHGHLLDAGGDDIMGAPAGAKIVLRCPHAPISPRPPHPQLTD
jgi:hypothetical protein